MANEDDEEQANTLAAVFPSAPPFYRHFTAENVRRIAELQESSDVDLSTVPEELRCLVPPDPPSNGTYRSFGDHYDINAPLPTLRSQGIEQLYETPPGSPSAQILPNQRFDRAQDLTKIARSILLNYLELVGLLSMNPEAAAEKIDDLRTLFINVHHLINEYRPHQARESLIAMMQGQVDERRAEIDGVAKMKEKVDTLLAHISDMKVEQVDKPTNTLIQEDRKRDARVDHYKRLWNELNAIK